MRKVLADALNRHAAINVRATIIDYLRRTPTRAEITAARRAAHRLAAKGHATIVHVPRPKSDSGLGSAYLILVRPGTTLTQQQLDGLASECADAARGSSRRFDPAVMALDLAEAVELLMRLSKPYRATSWTRLRRSG